MRRKKIAIVDYTLGNLFSVQRALEIVGAEAKITDSKHDLLDADKVVLPGVGAFEKGMEGLKEKDLVNTIKDLVDKGKPILGICLGMQMLMTQSEENGFWNGLDIVMGRVKQFDPPKNNDHFKIPQYGWNSVRHPESKVGTSPKEWKGTILQDVGEDPTFYFVHSFYVQPDDPAHSIGITSYGHNDFTSVLKMDNVTGCQFHPERSGPVGLELLKRFVFSND